MVETPSMGAGFIMYRYGPLLESPSTNTKATLLAAFFNAVDLEMLGCSDLAPTYRHRRIVSDLLRDRSGRVPFYSSKAVLFRDALPLVLDLDAAFAR
jgi:hypothetical protein